MIRDQTGVATIARRRRHPVHQIGVTLEHGYLLHDTDPAPDGGLVMRPPQRAH